MSAMSSTPSTHLRWGALLRMEREGHNLFKTSRAGGTSMVEGLSDLVAACGEHRPTSPAERIAEGETHWFIGYAAAAPAEMVALSQTEALKLFFRQEDVREVRHHGERFLVRVRDGANMMVSFEQVMKAAPTCG